MQEQKYLNGVKGIACIGVFLYHFYTSFCVQITTIEFNHTSMDVIMSGFLKPLIDGPLMVMLFALISGWLVSHARINRINLLIKKCILRYLRFIFPIVPIVLIVWILSKAKCFFTQEAYQEFGVLKNVYLSSDITFPGGYSKYYIRY